MLKASLPFTQLIGYLRVSPMLLFPSFLNFPFHVSRFHVSPFPLFGFRAT